MYRIEFSRKAARFYREADVKTARRLNLACTKLSQDPYKLHNVKRLHGELEGSFRLRLGDLRLVYSIDKIEQVVYIEVIGYRGDVYKR
jgi:mRNA interferase RelE/StbE